MKLKAKVPWICFKLRHALISGITLAVSSLPVITLPSTSELVTAVNCCSVLNCPIAMKHSFSDDMTFIQNCSNRPLSIQLCFFFLLPFQSLLCRSRGERRSRGILHKISSFSHRQPAAFGKTPASTIYPSSQGIYIS